MVKVLFFDSWTGGIHNFIPIAARLKERGVDSLLVHRGSWGDDPDRPAEETVNGLLVRDIRHYRTNLIYKVFAAERPDAVVILTTRTFIDRSVILAARALGITSFYLMHGAINVGDRHEGYFDGMRETLRKQRWTQAKKYLRLVLPNYFYSGTNVTAGFALRAYPWHTIWKTFADPAQYYWAPPAHPELHCDHALVWAEAYRQQIHRMPGYPIDRIQVIGPPPLDSAAALLANPPSQDTLREFRMRHRLSESLPLVVYLETPAVESGFSGWTAQSRLAHFDEIIELTWSAGKQLVIKLHPASERETLRKYENDQRVRILRDVELSVLVYAAHSIIGFVSTTLDIPIIFGKAILTPTWGVCASMPREYIERNLECEVTAPLDLATALKNDNMEAFLDKPALEKYVDDFITLTDGCAIERICNALASATS
jgi:hypothetical protein